ncbi:unnamed protein product [Parascedosporium putredinis]|uniref:Up-regulated during septation protein 1 domain-containing protein n=1 Tax=Parascedosporium putredinis TaxID=1442378 RepID=A0A9P1M6N8_9PEZI|nr:unnamed protein product [Parascedosporium putredinis]CAI7988770.1 unnamed protein product [Parascedosporium putredinis]
MKGSSPKTRATSSGPEDALRANPKETDRPRASTMVDLDDPIQVHLLTETALFDSRRYEILSEEEVDDLKKQCQSMAQRIEKTRANLAVQIKRTPIGSQASNRDSAEQADLERQATERRCDELATELWNLERRIMEPQRRLLEHTAAILQLTHKGSSKKQQQSSVPVLNGMPGSPESLYTYSNGRSSMDIDFQTPIEIPLKSPIREQTNKLREEADRLKQENDQLKAQSDAFGLEVDALRRETSDNEREISDLERKLETLNSSLRDVIVKFNPSKNSNFPDTISAVRQEQEQGQSRSRSVDEEASTAIAMAQAEGRLDALNNQITDLLLGGGGELELDDRISYLQYSLRVVEAELMQAVDRANNSARSAPSGGDDQRVLRELWDMVQDGFSELRRQREDRNKIRQEKGLEDDEDEMAISKLTEHKAVLKRQIKQQRELNNKSSGEKDIELQNKDAEIERRILEARNKEDELQSKLVELSATEAVLASKDAELLDLDKKVFDLEEKLSDLNMELSEARSTSSGTQAANPEELEAKDRRVRELEAELVEMQQILEKSRGDASQTQGMLVSALRDLDTLEEKTTKLAALETSSKDLESRLNMTEASRSELQTRMDEIDGKIETLEELDGKQREIKEKNDVLDSLNMMVVELKTELTIAQAELDGAYGSRAERAADVAAIKSNDQVNELHTQIDTLKTELDQTLKQLEDITRETITAEREKLEIEGRLDDTIAARATLEAEIEELRQRLDAEVLGSREKINKLQEELDTQRLKAVPTGEGGASRPGAGASMLSEQFRATMREERKKFQEDLREEQSRRRKLEEELTRLRKAAGPGKSPSARNRRPGQLGDRDLPLLSPSPYEFDATATNGNEQPDTLNTLTVMARYPVSFLSPILA